MRYLPVREVAPGFEDALHAYVEACEEFDALAGLPGGCSVEAIVAASGATGEAHDALEVVICDSLAREEDVARDRDAAHAFVTEVREVLGEDYAGPEANWRRRSIASIQRVKTDRDALAARVEVLTKALTIAMTYGLPPHDVSGSAQWEIARAALLEGK
jgi:hypothetical protein